MSKPERVTVYSFHLYRGHVESPEVAAYKATLPAIESMGGRALHGTAQEVPADELDDGGRYRRVNTGWGVLD